MDHRSLVDCQALACPTGLAYGHCVIVFDHVQASCTHSTAIVPTQDLLWQAYGRPTSQQDTCTFWPDIFFIGLHQAQAIPRPTVPNFSS